MPFYEIMEDSSSTWYDDEEHATCSVWSDGMSDLYLRAEEAWPNGASIQHAFHGEDGLGSGHADDEPGDFDD